MKKNAFILFSLLIASCLSAQPAGVVDSLIGLPVWYGASDNYQNCDWFQTCPEEYLDRNYFCLDYYAGRGDSIEMLVTKAFTDHQLAVKGVAVMTLTDMDDVNPYTPQVYFYDTSRVEEEVMIWNGDVLEGLPPIATATWYKKTVEKGVSVPQCTQTMASGDDSKFLHFGLAEVYFQHSVAVDSFFFIGGTLRNNATVVDIYGGERFLHKPTLYPYVTERYMDLCNTCDYGPGHFVGTNAPEGEWYRLDDGKMWSGPFFLILDTNRYRLTALSSNDTMGVVSGSGIYDPLEQVSVEAIPLDGYRFVHWNDGMIENPRVVEVLSDTTLMAVFRDINDTTGIDDVSNYGPTFSLYPNPTQNEVFVNTSEIGQLQLQLVDASGRLLMAYSFVSHIRIDVSSLSAGQYFLMVTGGKGTRVEPFVKR